ncbi:carboxypeptidase-like regulatory domain-containing protein [Aureibaculum sp. 2210JD6-5]|uniref:carboxypeptidase-like regulatory domain-containing protein n=1 Tax=Aureibaculum sp. 2210JD6-5 TaxID=3103957 RepID=UPI002AAE7F32|nr:carboxypeptidase-like regulatory domain-containing protein [Aureibaculum sp. 2210JD6-5]MDY7396342.1 carboxypeptidase-like regulatory domain-containing protein [Aureibaculum sp. 2210JD6-5]
MQKIIPTFLSLFLCISTLVAQNEDFNPQDSIKILKGRIIDVNDKTPLQSAHIVNLNSAEGTITNTNGHFEIPAQANDTLHISYIGYQSIKLKITNDLLRGNELEIAIHEKTLDIDEVTVKVHNLIGVLEIDAKNVPKDSYSRIHIEGLPQTYEIGRPKERDYSGVGAALFNPVDFWYNKFGKKPKELKKLKKLKEQDNSRDMMEEKFSREILMDYMDMSRKELDDLLKECNYSNSFVKKASDLQIIEAVLECYENYRAIKKGTVTKDKIRVNDQEKN